MSFKKDNFYKDPLEDLGSDLSEISDVKPEDLSKILKSATELDKQIFPSEPTKSPKLSEPRSSISFRATVKKPAIDDPLAEFSLSSEEESLPKVSTPKRTEPKDRVSSLFGIGEVKEEETTLGTAKGRGSGDWLGLKETPEKPATILEDISLSRQTKDTKDIIGDVPKSLTLPEVPKTSPTPWSHSADKKEPPKAPGRKRVNILDDLFGDTLIKKDEQKFDLAAIKPSFPESETDDSGFRVQSKTDIIKDKVEQDETASYLPSLSSGRKIERRKESGILTNLGFETDAERTLNIKDKAVIPEGSKTSATDNIERRTITPSKSVSKHTLKESSIIDWLGSSSLPQEQILASNEQTNNLTKTIHVSKGKETEQEIPEWLSSKPSVSGAPEWLNGKPTVSSIIPQAVSTPLIEPAVEENVQAERQTVIVASGSNSVLGQLANVKAQLKVATAKHNQNLEAYMQALMNEAQRVTIMNQLVQPEVVLSHTINQDQGERPKDKNTDKNLEMIKDQEDIIHDLEVKVNRLELQLLHSEMKIANMESIKEMEIESLKKAHGFEMSALESQLERAKNVFEEITAEYEEKIVKLKNNAEEIEKHTKERLEALQAERMADLEKLGEFHRLVLEQAATLTIPNLGSAGAPIRFPLKLLKRPADEVELSDREINLIEKERQVEILKEELEAEKRELDEALEKEKVRRDEREREARRILLEAQFREEMNNKELERKKEQMDLMQKQLQTMREEALKEQSELAKEKLELAAEKARIQAGMKIERTSDMQLLQPLDMFKAKAELEAALDAAREAREIADQERRRHIELRKSVEEITWEQKDKDQQLDMRERHINNILKDAEATKAEGIAALQEAEAIRREFDEREKEIRGQIIQFENKEKHLAKERMEIAKERLELEKQKSQLEVFLPTLEPQEELNINPPRLSDKGFIDPKALIMKLKAEKDFESMMGSYRRQS